MNDKSATFERVEYLWQERLFVLFSIYVAIIRLKCIKIICYKKKIYNFVHRDHSDYCLYYFVFDHYNVI